jgi:hypothetical protein
MYGRRRIFSFTGPVPSPILPAPAGVETVLKGLGHEIILGLKWYGLKGLGLERVWQIVKII